MIAYADDVHIVAPPHVVARALSALVAPSPPVDPSLDCRLAPLGLELSPGKTSIFLGAGVSPQVLRDVLQPIIDLIDAKVCCGDSSSECHHHGVVHCKGHKVLGSPMGSPEFVFDFVKGSVDEAVRLRALLASLLLDRDAVGGESSGIFAPDTFDTVLRYCIAPRVTHLLRTLPPGVAASEFSRFHSDLLNYHLDVSPPSVSPEVARDFSLSSPHFEVRRVASLPLSLGGRGLSSPHRFDASGCTSDSLSSPASHHDAAFYGSWAASWRLMCAWCPLLSPDLPSDHSAATLPFQAQVLAAWARIHSTLTSVRDNPRFSKLPHHLTLPTIFDQILDGPTPPPEERLSPAIIYSPQDLSTKIITQKTQHLISAITSAFEFLELLGAPSTDDAGRARLLDGASAPGPSSWLARVPSAPKFRFLESTVDPISARAADLLACPPHLLGGHCPHCSHAESRPVPLGDDARHFVNCRKGLRLHCAVSDRVRDTLVDLLQAAGEKVVAERPGTHRQITEFMALEGRSLKKNPDLVLCNFDGPRSFTVIDVKVCDPAAPTYRTRSGDCALFRHSQLERDGPKDYFGQSRTPPPGNRMRVVTFVVSTFGSLGREANNFLKQVSRSRDHFLPPPLLPESSWATPNCSSFLRSAITMEVRKRVAALLREPE